MNKESKVNEPGGSRSGARIPADHLDQLLENASMPPENPWFATQVLHRLREKHAGQRKIWPNWFVWSRLSPWRSLLQLPIPLRTALAICVIAAVGWGMLAYRGSADSAHPTAASQENFAAAITAPEEEIPDEVVVAELEVLMADLNFQLWQQEETAL